MEDLVYADFVCWYRFADDRNDSNNEENDESGENLLGEGDDDVNEFGIDNGINDADGFRHESRTYVKSATVVECELEEDRPKCRSSKKAMVFPADPIPPRLPWKNVKLGGPGGFFYRRLRRFKVLMVKRTQA
eukprot:Pompholyxophrys_punicea_v1_NODE_102_length_3479_cov_3.570386.p3 type:complete len:132 gc:universal NODE_102_length_3479_cov_3.570386:128-523(+)